MFIGQAEQFDLSITTILIENSLGKLIKRLSLREVTKKTSSSLRTGTAFRMFQQALSGLRNAY